MSANFRQQLNSCWFWDISNTNPPLVHTTSKKLSLLTNCTCCVFSGCNPWQPGGCSLRVQCNVWRRWRWGYRFRLWWGKSHSKGMQTLIFPPVKEYSVLSSCPSPPNTCVDCADCMYLNINMKEKAFQYTGRSIELCCIVENQFCEWCNTFTLTCRYWSTFKEYCVIHICVDCHGIHGSEELIFGYLSYTFRFPHFSGCVFSIMWMFQGVYERLLAKHHNTKECQVCGDTMESYPKSRSICPVYWPLCESFGWCMSDCWHSTVKQRNVSGSVWSVYDKYF